MGNSVSVQPVQEDKPDRNAAHRHYTWVGGGVGTDVHSIHFRLLLLKQWSH